MNLWLSSSNCVSVWQCCEPGVQVLDVCIPYAHSSWWHFAEDVVSVAWCATRPGLLLLLFLLFSGCRPSLLCIGFGLGVRQSVCLPHADTESYQHELGLQSLYCHLREGLYSHDMWSLSINLNWLIPTEGVKWKKGGKNWWFSTNKSATTKVIIIGITISEMVWDMTKVDGSHVGGRACTFDWC